MATEQLPTCPRCTKVRHRIVEMRLDTDSNDWKRGRFWSFYCPLCNFLYVRSKPESRIAHAEQAAYERRMTKLKQLREYESRPRYFDLGATTSCR